MKRLKLPYNVLIRMPPDGSGVSFTALSELEEAAWRNKMVVIECALAIEFNLELIISNYFFEPPAVKKWFFEDVILRSKWCTVDVKLNIASQVLQKLDLLTSKKEIEAFETVIRKSMKWRNAFTHGRISSNGQAVFLSFFEKGPQTKELDESYLQDVENDLFDTYKKTSHLITAVLQKMGTLESAKLWE